MYTIKVVCFIVDEIPLLAPLECQERQPSPFPQFSHHREDQFRGRIDPQTLQGLHRLWFQGQAGSLPEKVKFPPLSIQLGCHDGLESWAI
ncbi:hypothetical protein SAY86_001111 [Trapa natans]|uniref:Uncharacterized protein n=1 Tax=Trapa natans TaxID=22666 RepID=A0AAN7RNK7_TRANT|nr:hypothetical protein SAY86_001111 [Trapa natans]